MKRHVLLFVIMLAAGAAWAQAGLGALTVRATELRAQAQADGAVLASLPEHTRLEVLRRSGAWSEVKTAGGQSGWVRMLNLKLEAGAPAPGAAPAGNAANPLGALGSLLSSGRSSNSATVTTGVRGLSAEDIQNAQANPAELERVQKFAVDKGVAQTFAQRAKLTPVKLEYFPAAAPARSNTPRAEGG